MKICMMTNTYLPHVGGVARSVSTFAEEYLRQGHEVLVVAPTFAGKRLPAKDEAIVERVPAIEKFNGSEFSVRLPLAAVLSERLDAFKADIIHAHHPFLLGDTALRVATNKNVPIVFTHHTRYEDYTHYMPLASEALTKVAKELPTHFANMCDGVIAPSESIARTIRRRGVETPMTVIPTGIDVAAFARAEGAAFRKKMGLAGDTFVVGHVGRLAQEKNLSYLAEAVALFLQRVPEARFLVVGEGPARDELKATFEQHGVAERLLLAGKRTGRVLREAYRAMDVFAFTSMSETQGMVVAEAMAAGLPVVALNASGVREVVRDAQNGFMLPSDTPPEKFAEAIAQIAKDRELWRTLGNNAQATAGRFSREQCAARVIAFYEEIRRATRRRRLINDLHPWQAFVQRLGLEWDLLATRTSTIANAVFGESDTKEAS
jgi:1,2-diacylglycerol 3-alpha-glucosyltransferase